MKFSLTLTFIQFTLAIGAFLRGREEAPAVIQGTEQDESIPTPGRSLLVYPPKRVENGLIIRVIGQDESGNSINPILDENEAYRRAFADTNSAAEQFHECSGGDFTFVPFEHSALPQSGIITIRVTESPYSTYSRNTIRQAADAKVCEYFGLTAGCDVGIDHKMFILPNGLSNGNSMGFLSGAVGGDYSIFGDSPLYRVSSFDTEGILHEVAHNFRIGHAYHEGNSYGDDSGPMGGTYYLWGANNGNKRCYNGYNVWALQWQSDRIIEVPTGESGTATLNGFADIAQLGETDYLTIKYGNYFVMYNRQTGSNSGTKEYGDRILIHERRPRKEGSDYFDSHLVGILDQTGQTTLGDVTFQVCESGSLWPKTTVKVAVGVGASCSDGPISSFYSDPTTPTTTDPTTTSVPTTTEPTTASTASPATTTSTSTATTTAATTTSTATTTTTAATTTSTATTTTTVPTSAEPTTTTSTHTTGGTGPNECERCGGGNVSICVRSRNRNSERCVSISRAESLFEKFPDSTCGPCV